MKQILIFGFLAFGLFYSASAQEVLTKTNGGASWETPSDDNGIYSGSGTVPSSVNVSVTDNITFDLNTFYIDATSDEVGIVTTSPVSTLDVNGSVSFVTRTLSSGTHTLGSSDYTLLLLTSNSKTVNLPSAANCAGRVYRILNRGGGTTFSLGAGSLYVNTSGLNQNTIPANSVLEIQSIGGVWVQINNY
jgi:hypothetical protein